VPDKTKSVLRRENIFWADDDPVNRVTTYIPWEIAKGTGLTRDEVPHQHGIHGVLEDRHHVMTRLQEEVSARMPRLMKSRPCGCGPGCRCWMSGTPASTRTASRTSRPGS
jgi:GntR family transcriptional regulator